MIWPSAFLGKTPGAGPSTLSMAPADASPATRNQSWSQEQDDITGGAERGNGFGSALVGADFNGDGYDDLGVGLPGEDGGSVIVIYGSANRLTSQGNQRWRQGDNGILRTALTVATTSAPSSVAGDFDGDGFKDLAIGVPREDGGEGVVHAIYGAADVTDKRWESALAPGYQPSRGRRPSTEAR